MKYGDTKKKTFQLCGWKVFLYRHTYKAKSIFITTNNPAKSCWKKSYIAMESAYFLTL